MIHTYGYNADSPDQRDHIFSAHWRELLLLPSYVNLEALCPPAYDQGNLGSCGPNAGCGAYEYELKKQGLTDFMPSRLFVYYYARPAHLRGVDSGTTIRSIVKTLAQQGTCPESEWPYDIAKFTEQPAAQCAADALKERVILYQRIPQALPQMKACLAAGFPFIFGFTVYSSFESDAVAQTGFVPMPGPGESVLGGHAVVAVGYDDASQRFLIRNSWGTGWGQQGYCTMPYAYLLSSGLSSDFWTIRTVQ